ncbi:unnamed protein product [Penicillium glandicola]
MVCSASDIKMGILSIRVVLESPNWCMSATSVCCFEIGWIEEHLHIEIIPLLACQRRSLGGCRNCAESRFIGVASMMLVCSYIDPQSMFELYGDVNIPGRVGLGWCESQLVDRWLRAGGPQPFCDPLIICPVALNNSIGTVMGLSHYSSRRKD